jgi:hypothetical protein
MANYVPMARTGMAWSWLINLPEGSLTSWEELCRQFMAISKNAYAHPGNKVDLHDVQ